jgi:hypothetical protein
VVEKSGYDSEILNVFRGSLFRGSLVCRYQSCGIHSPLEKLNFSQGIIGLGVFSESTIHGLTGKELQFS